jgi:2-dehydro-3-deoxy-D-arabinonate dehydratase
MERRTRRRVEVQLTMRLFRTTKGAFVEEQGRFHVVNELSNLEGWDRLICDPELHERARAALGNPPLSFDPESVLAPIGSQEVWAAGVTYYRSRDARIQESKDNGGGTFYDRVYSAERPELFFKATGRRVVGPGEPVNIRSDANWSVPEPELTLFINPAGNIVGCTIGNDMSARDIEGENPLYLPQAKVYTRSCALGPCILLGAEPSRSTTISLEIMRQGEVVFSGCTSLKELKRELKELVHFLFLDNDFPAGVFLMTGTGIVPNESFALQRRDSIRIRIDEIGMLENCVA